MSSDTFEITDCIPVRPQPTLKSFFMTTERKARLAFIGAGSFATGKLYPCIAASSRIDLRAVCDLDPEKAAANARDFGAPHAYTDIEEMLDKVELDGVFCVGPAPMQYELAPTVLRRGLPIFVEKPSAVTSEQALRLAQLAEEHQTWGQVGFMKRFATVYRMAKDVLTRHEFGPVHLLKIRFAQGPYPQLWGIDSPHRSMLIGQLCHVFDLARFFCGDITAVTASYHAASPTQFAYLVNAEYSSGVIGHFDLNSLESQASFRDIVEEVQIVGQGTNVLCRDMLTLEWQPKEDWTSATPDAGRYLHSFTPTWCGLHPSPAFLGYQGEIDHFAKRCLGEAEGGPDLWDSARSLQIGEAVYESAVRKESVSIPCADMKNR
jgi:predicted dehydrogenase